VAKFDRETTCDVFGEVDYTTITSNEDLDIRLNKAALSAFSKYPDPAHPLKLSKAEAWEVTNGHGNASALRDVLKEHHETAASLAKWLGVSRQVVSAWVSNPETVPAVDVMLLRYKLKAEISTMRGVPAFGENGVSTSGGTIPVFKAAVDPYGSPLPQDDFLMIWGTLDQSDRLTLERVACALSLSEFETSPALALKRYASWMRSGQVQLEMSF
jgi:hypothetical protein